MVDQSIIDLRVRSTLSRDATRGVARRSVAATAAQIGAGRRRSHRRRGEPVSRRRRRDQFVVDAPYSAADASGRDELVPPPGRVRRRSSPRFPGSSIVHKWSRFWGCAQSNAPEGNATGDATFWSSMNTAGLALRTKYASVYRV